MNPVWRTYGTSDRRWLYGWEDLAARMKPETVGQGFDYNHPIARMCGGVPLALLCLFSAMALIREQQEQLGVNVNASDVQDMIEKQIKQCGIQNTPGFEALVESLQIGYDNLPHHMLKTCLLHCSIYPENYHFHMNDLVMRWVAEGFTYKRDAAEDYLKELHNRGLMLWAGYGACRMNPIMRNFLRWKSREDNFITCSSDIKSSCAFTVHRLCIDNYQVDDGADAVEGVDPLFGLDWSQIRSLVVFEGAKRYAPFEKLEHVRVLDLQYHQQHLEFEERVHGFRGLPVRKALGNHHVKVICGLPRVRHLFGLEGTGISEIPSEIARLQYLETLQVRFTSIMELPNEIGDLQQLKTLAVSHNRQLAELPREIGDLQHLETLELSYNGRLKELPREIGNLQNLENLNLHHTKLKELPPETGKLQHLKTLEVGWASMTRLGSEIGDLHHLETLDLSHNFGLTQLPREIGKLQNLKRLRLRNTGVMKTPREIGGLKKLENVELDYTMGTLPWEACQLSKLEGVPECIRQAWKKSDLVSCVLAREILSVKLFNGLALSSGGLIVGTKHMGIPRWIKDHFNDLGSLDIRMCKLEEEQDLKILREMPKLRYLGLRLEVVPRDPIAITGEGFTRLELLLVDCRMPRVITFQEGAMPILRCLTFEFQFYGGPPPSANRGDPRLGIKHLRRLSSVAFSCNEEWYGGAAESSPCISAMIEVVRKEAQEHPKKIDFLVSGRGDEEFPANESLAREVSQSSSAENEMKSLAQEVSSSTATGPEILEAAAA